MNEHFPSKTINGVNYTLKEHELGFFQLSPIPSTDELKTYYESKYYQNPQVSTYQHQYSEKELRLHQIQAEVIRFIWNNDHSRTFDSVLDIGCGEGFFLNEFDKQGIKVSGNDYSPEGIGKFNPHLKDRVVFGNGEQDIKNRIEAGELYDVINLGNVLEHVQDPVQLLKNLSPLLSDDGMIRIIVPNDASAFQGLLREQKFQNFEWFHPLDHISYFSFDSLIKLSKECGYKANEVLGEFPIEIFLMNSASNYVLDKTKGKSAHHARVEISNFIFDQGVDAYVQWAKGLAASRLGRTIVCFLQKA